MDVCPNCNANVDPGASRCPRCGLPHNLPVYAPDGSYLGTSFGPPQGANQQAGPPPGYSGTAFARAYAGTAGGRQAAIGRRARFGLITAGVLTVAVVLGVVTAIVVNVSGRAGPQPSPALPPTPASPSANPTPSASTRPPTPTPTPTPRRAPTPTPTPKVDYAKVAAAVRSGVVGVLASTCRPGPVTGIGAGALISDTEVLTSWPTAAYAVSVVVLVDRIPVPATVVAADPAAGVARLKLARTVSGHHFAVSGADLVGATAHLLVLDPRHQQTAWVRQAKTAGPGSGKVADQTYTLPQLAPDTGVMPGGAPVLDPTGRLAGMALALDARAGALVLGHSALAKAITMRGGVPATDCGAPRGPTGDLGTAGNVTSPFTTYFRAINDGDYAKAYGELSTKNRAHVPRQQAYDGWKSSYDFNVRVHRRTGSTAWVSFDSIFANGLGPEPGITCAHWVLNYSLAGGKIDNAKAHAGRKKPWVRC